MLMPTQVHRVISLFDAKNGLKQTLLFKISS